MNAAAPPYLSESDLARRWRCSRSSIQRAVRAGRVPYVTSPVAPTRRLYRIADIEALERNGEHDAVVVGLPSRRNGHLR